MGRRLRVAAHRRARSLSVWRLFEVTVYVRLVSISPDFHNGVVTMPNPQHAILTDLTKYQWYTHLSRTEGADLGVIKQALRDVRAAGSDVGVTTPVNVCLLFGPTLL